MSTARDMSLLGRHVLYDYPEYYNLFSRRSTHAGVRNVANTNRRLLAAYRGADGIKTGYTRAAGFNLVASAERGQERIIATVFGGTSTIARNARVAELLDMGFKRAPSRAKVRKPQKPSYFATRRQGTRDATIMNASLRPQIRPLIPAVESPVNAEDILAAVEQAKTSTAGIASTTGILNSDIKSALIEAQETPAKNTVVPLGGVAPVSIRPAMRPKNLINASLSQPAENEVVTRLSTSGGRQWGVNVGQFNSRYLAERALLTTALTEMETLEGTLRKVVRRSTGFDANFLGMTEDSAELACRRLEARNITCKTVGPS